MQRYKNLQEETFFNAYFKENCVYLQIKINNDNIKNNGYKTKIEAVYYINDGNMDKYKKAVELANMYKLPLIELKKTN